MSLALVFFLLVTSAGLAVQRMLGLGRLATVIGLAPAVGLASFAVVASLATIRGLPLSFATAFLIASALADAIIAARGIPDVRQTLVESAGARLAWTVLVVALGACAIVAASGFWGVEVPLWLDDGSFHVENIESLRRGEPWTRR